MEKTFTIFNRKYQYKKDSRNFHHIFGYQGKRRQKIIQSYTSKEFISGFLYNSISFELHIHPGITWKDIKHTCKNREMRKVLEKYLRIAFEMVRVGCPYEYLKRLQKKSAKIYLKYWKFPTDLEQNVLSFLPEPDSSMKQYKTIFGNYVMGKNQVIYSKNILAF